MKRSRDAIGSPVTASSEHPRPRPRDDRDGAVRLSFIEFFCGVGGWTAAVEAATQSIFATHGVTVEWKCCAALDHSDLCMAVYQHNFGGTPPANAGVKRQGSNSTKQCRIETLTIEQLNEWKADVWLMSPPCQPHTRQHANQDRDLLDPRSASFLHLVRALGSEDLMETAIPSLICLENVLGFERSRSMELFLAALSQHNFVVAQLSLQPTQVGFPNDRPRYYCVAVRRSSFEKASPINEECRLHNYFHPIKMDGVCPLTTCNLTTAIPEMQIPPVGAISLETIKTLADFMDANILMDSQESESLRVPLDVVDRSASWCFDIVLPTSRRSACFTSGYGRFIRGTGSVLYVPDGTGGDGSESVLAADRVALQLPKDRGFDPDWARKLQLDKRRLRYFSGTEMARLLGFPGSFSFPDHVSLRQQWKLMGNSLNVAVAAKVVEVGLSFTGMGSR